MLKAVREYHYVMTEQANLRKSGCSEVTYTDHWYIDTSGLKIAEEIGVEDFDLDQWKTIRTRTVYAPAGKNDKQGNPILEYVGTVRARTEEDCRLIAKLVMGDKPFVLRGNHK